MRRWRDSDREPFAELNGDPQTLVFFPNTLDRAASDALVDRIEARFDEQGFGLWALEVAETGQFIGFTGLSPMRPGVPGAGGMEVGWRLARQRLASRLRDGGGQGRPDRRLRGRGAGRDLVHDRGAQRAVPGGHAPAGTDRGGPVRHPNVPAGHRLRPHVAYHLARAGAA